jgi:hypothetical protein
MGQPNARPDLADLGLTTGKKARLHRILHRHGLGNGTAIFLPYDHCLEHGPRDFFANPVASDPGYIIRLALEGGFNGIAVQIGQAEKFYWDYAGQVPLVLKLNGKTDIPSAIDPLSPLSVRAGRDAETGCPQRRPTAALMGAGARHRQARLHPWTGAECGPGLPVRAGRIASAVIPQGHAISLPYGQMLTAGLRTCHQAVSGHASDRAGLADVCPSGAGTFRPGRGALAGMC